MSLDKLVSAGLSETVAAEFYSTLIGATVVAVALKEPAIFERAVGGSREMCPIA
jgi:hypothetical protein